MATATVFGVALLWRIDHMVGALVLPLAALALLVPAVWSGQPIHSVPATAHVHAAISILTYAVLCSRRTAGAHGSRGRNTGSAPSVPVGR